MSWVVDMEKQLEDAEQPAKLERWPKQCIFRVPLRFKVVDGSMYKPQTVSLGPFHHGDEELRSMEEHKLRAVRHLLRRGSCKTTLDGLVGAMEEVAEELQDAYMDLGDEWRGEENRGKFLKIMITDGCFLLEMMRTTVGGKDSIPKDYMHGDPVFSWHGIQHIKPFVQRDMLMVENQLPLRLLEKILAMESGTPPSATSINSMVLKFLERKDAPKGADQLGLHPLDIYRTSLLKGTSQPKGTDNLKGKGKDPYRGVETMPEAAVDVDVVRVETMPEAAADVDVVRVETMPEAAADVDVVRVETMPEAAADVGVVRLPRVVPRSAWKLSEAGIRFVPSETSCLDDINLDNWTLNMPKVQLDDSTAYRFHNMMAFEAMHVGTSNDVTAYVLFVKDLVDSAEDVRLLVKKRVLEHDLADDDAAVVRLFNGLTRDVSKNWESWPCRVRENVENHYRNNRLRVFLYESWAYLWSKYFRSPWTLLALLTAVLLVFGDIVQAVYAVISYDPNEKGKPKMH